MDDQLDKDLSRRIKEVFDNYHDASANEGWLKLREKFPAEKRRRGLIWLWPAAALLLFFLGLGLVKLFNAQQTNHIAHVKRVKQSPAILNKHNDSIIAHNATPAQPQIKDNDKAGAQTIANRNNAVAIAYQKQAQGGVNPSVNSGLPQVITINQQSSLSAHVDTVKKNNINLNNSATQQLAVATKQNAVTKPDTQVAHPVAVAKKPSNINEMFAADQSKTPNDLQVKEDRRIKFSVYAATYVSYTKNGNNQVNAGGGFTAAIPLSKNLKFVTGASVNQNSFSYNNNPVVIAAAYPSAAMYFVPKGYSNFSPAVPTSYSRDASLLGIDVPLNLQYQFNTKKYPVYVLGGISSGTFINESYSYLYANGSSQQFQGNKGLNDFYFARTLNFGFGVGYPVGKSQIVIEPFLKYPLEGMGAQQLKFGASGINLKFNFPTKK